MNGGLALAKAVANEPQPGILAPTPARGRYLTCQLRVGAHPHTVLRQRTTQADGASTVIDLGASLARQLDAHIPGSKSFRGIDGAHIKLHATPADLWIWLRGTDSGELLIRSRHLEALLAPAFDVQHITDTCNHDNGKDLTGYEDGAAKPQDEEAFSAALAPESASPLAGSSIVAVQRWHHHMSRFEAIPRLQHDHTIDRDTDRNEELDDGLNRAHVKRTAQEASIRKPLCCAAPCLGLKAMRAAWCSPLSTIRSTRSRRFSVACQVLKTAWQTPSSPSPSPNPAPASGAHP